MEFEADPVKAAENFKKHKVRFEEAASIFGDSMDLLLANKRDIAQQIKADYSLQ